MSIALNYSARTDVGLVRSRNEDSGYAGPHLLAVADGMGGHAGGNVASSIVLARLAPLDGDSHGSDDALALLGAAIAQANRDLAAAMAADPALTGMGTTLSALMRSGPTGLALVHIGDSRAYLLRDGRFTQITKDHSFVQTLVDSGQISTDEAEHHPQRALVTRVLTGNAEDDPDLTMRQARRGDRYLICSDGLSDVVGIDTITEVVTAGHSPDDTGRRLIDLALRSGAPDNITVVIADIVDPLTSPPSSPQIVGAAAERRLGGLEDTAGPRSPAARAAALRRTVTGTAPEEGGVLLAEEDRGGRRRWGRLLAVLAIALLAVLGGLYAAYDWTQRQYYVGLDDGHVAVYRGVPQSLGPWELSSVYRRTDIAQGDLPPLAAQAVTGDVSVGGLDQVENTVRQLSADAALCRAKKAQQQQCGTPADLAPSVPVTRPTPSPGSTKQIPGIPQGAAPGPSRNGTAAARPTPRTNLPPKPLGRVPATARRPATSAGSPSTLSTAPVKGTAR